MKKIVSLLLFVITVFSALAQEQQDSIGKNNSKQYFIGAHIGSGLENIQER